MSFHHFNCSARLVTDFVMEWVEINRGKTKDIMINFLHIFFWRIVWKNLKTDVDVK